MQNSNIARKRKIAKLLELGLISGSHWLHCIMKIK